ncbi:MAG: T9SS type A sorting domain-containing protein [Aureispira sp.]|nr:T9SS type A sorting domain-containing protein [Aureispira sp.]
MYHTLIFSLLLLIPLLGNSQNWQISTHSPMPEKVSNNAVCEGFIGNTPYVFSFGGIDSTKLYSGIHLRSFRYNVQTDVWDTIPPLPDTLGKIAASASRVGNVIYIIGGYHVYANGGEKSSKNVHRYDIASNSYLSDGPPIPVAIDDQAQVVWRDSLIYVITGWSNTGNVPNVQVYNPSTDSWIVGTSVPNNNNFKAFGTSGTIIGDTIYYYGGASTASGFPAQNLFRRGVINSIAPYAISWKSPINSLYNGYRTAATTAMHKPYWLGGATTSYNYNGLSYVGSVGVEPAGQVVSIDPFTLARTIETGYNLPMDLRSLANISDTVKYIVGGMLSGQQVSDQTYRVVFNPQTTTNAKKVANTSLNIELSPNPAKDYILLKHPTVQGGSYQILNLNGQELIHKSLTAQQTKIDLQELPTGVYLLSVVSPQGRWTEKLIIW